MEEEVVAAPADSESTNPQSRLNKLGALEGQPDQDDVVLASPTPKHRLHQVETLGDQPDEAVVALDSPTPRVDLTKWELTKISLTKVLSFSDSPIVKST